MLYMNAEPNSVKSVEKIEERIKELSENPTEPDVYTNMQRRRELMWVLGYDEEDYPPDLSGNSITMQLSTVSIQASQLINEIDKLTECYSDELDQNVYDIKRKMRLLKKRVDVAHNVSTGEDKQDTIGSLD